MSDAKIDVSPGTLCLGDNEAWVYCRKNFPVDELPVQHMLIDIKGGTVKLIYPAMHGSVSKAIEKRGFTIKES